MSETNHVVRLQDSNTELSAQLSAKDAEIARLRKTIEIIKDHCQDGSHVSKQILKIIDWPPSDCRDPNSCERNSACMYIPCIHARTVRSGTCR